MCQRLLLEVGERRVFCMSDGPSDLMHMVIRHRCSGGSGMSSRVRLSAQESMHRMSESRQRRRRPWWRGGMCWRWC